MKRFFQSRNGMETIEAAITTPIAVLIMLATINLGMVIFGQQTLYGDEVGGAIVPQEDGDLLTELAREVL